MRTCSKKIQLAEAQLQKDPKNEEVRGILSDSQSKLAEFFQESVERNRHLSSSSWLRYGDTCFKNFFDFHRVGKKKTILREIMTESSSITAQKDLFKFITEFYTNLYASEAYILGAMEAQAECWASVPRKVLQDTNEALTRDLRIKNILEAIRALPKGKALGHDGVPMEFFHELAEEVALSLLSAFTEMLSIGSTSAFINKGFITLIPKAGDRAKLGNWRPITLLGSVYKILAKTLAGRISSALTNVIKPNQTGFVEGRSILDNIFMAQEALGWVEESEQDLVLLLLDFEKAFDRIEWGFLFTTLTRLGFSDKWVRWVASLYQDTTSAIKINGSPGPDFRLERSVRQGCPLAPYLFILATDVLGHMLDDPKYGIEGLTLPRGGLVRDQTFADDTALYPKGHPANLDRAKEVLRIFCRASGAKINWHKSATIWASKKGKPWEWGEDVGLKWIPAGKGTWYLGIQVGFRLPTEANFNTVMLSLKAKLIRWSHSSLSLAGRFLVANQVLLASLWYLAACWNPSPKMCSRVRGVIKNFIWGGKDEPAHHHGNEGLSPDKSTVPGAPGISVKDRQGPSQPEQKTSTLLDARHRMHPRPPLGLGRVALGCHPP